MPPEPPPELVVLLFGPQAVSMTSLLSNRLAHWADAFDAWLDHRERAHNRNIRIFAVKPPVQSPPSV
jgi:hypothetical protein